MATEILLKLQEVLDEAIPDVEDTKDNLLQLSDAVKDGGPDVRELMLKLGAYETVMKAWKLLCFSGQPNVIIFRPAAAEIRNACLVALYTLTAGNSEIIDDLGWLLVQESVDNRIPTSTQTQGLRLIRNICIKSERNREHIAWEVGMMEKLVLLVKRDKLPPTFIKEWCGAMKALILSDDTRVAYNKAPERKRIIFQLGALQILARYLYNTDDEPTMNAIVVFLGSMAATENMCIAIESGNVFPAIQNILKTCSHNQMLIKNTLSFLRYLNVSQTVRDKCGGYGLVKWVLQQTYYHKHFPEIAEVGLSCLAFMTLRNACQAAQLVGEGGVGTIFQIIRLYDENSDVLKAGCLLLRNLAANGGRAKVLEHDGEQLIRRIQEKFPELKVNYTMPALRDLQVLTEEELPAMSPKAAQELQQTKEQGKAKNN